MDDDDGTRREGGARVREERGTRLLREHDGVAGEARGGHEVGESRLDRVEPQARILRDGGAEGIAHRAGGDGGDAAWCTVRWSFRGRHGGSWG
ncbi:hypothetical protein OVA14_06910 [Agrococcus sp. SL85]|uniref:hypothetical protein n=1 Tax=Agrococcus sp. SL85 TaxID=2995141 RepID=UPI00226C9707|nr:hypothetical protein [Agrococcus sp. SL85]WAC65126.1 hypothetical protein OVA14_06910 [Agrococcus sp. SL85]